MLKSVSLSLFCLLLFCSAQAQVFTSSNLPIILINTDINPATGQPKPIVDDPRVLGSMKIIYRTDGTRNYVSDASNTAFLDYNGRIDIEIRGSSSQDLPKKSYGFSTLLADNVSENNVRLLDMPAEHDWILSAIGFDTAMVRDYLSYNLARQLGYYASRTSYCEVMINGQYAGLYLLLEKVKRDENRVDVLSMTTSDNTAPNISGGYITKCDKLTGGDPVAWNMSTYNWNYPASFIHHYPSPDNVTNAQDDYIHNVFLSLASKSNTHNSSISTGYPTVIDVPSFVDYMLMNELGSNADGYQLSTFFHKDRNGKLRAGPIWDFNLTFGNDLFLYGLDRSKPDVWQFSDGGNDGAKFWTDLFETSTFKCYMSKRWNELIQPGQPFNYDVLSASIDATVDSISEALVRENQKWDNVPNHALEITNLKSFITARIDWMTDNLGGFSACSNVTVPPLVITKINYHPDSTAAFPIRNDLEFVEIKNNGNQDVDLTGIYFRELGFTYSFPAGATLAANTSLHLASNPTAFQAKYNKTAFGQFTRNLSNKSQKLVLVDAFGNLIDEVEYQDQAPWPTDADGNGPFLTLIDINLDNALASSWVSGEPTLDVQESVFETSTEVFPNPTSSILYVRNSTYQIQSCEVFDFQGRFLFAQNSQNEPLQLDTKSLPNSHYMLKINFSNGVVVSKQFIKQD